MKIIFLLLGCLLAEEETQSHLETEVSCNREVLIAYGMKGYAKAHVIPHPHCPSIRENCCTPDDAAKSYKMWQKQLKFDFEAYYQTFLYSLKYTLGYSSEVYSLAKRIKKQLNSNSDVCSKAADDIISLNMNPFFTADMYQVIKKALLEFIELRKGFYCIICNSTTQSKLQDFWGSNNRVDSIVYFSKNFCQKLVDKTIQASFYKAIILKKYLDSTSQLINCQENRYHKIQYEIPIAQQRQISNCYHFQYKFFFYFCENYCENFDLVNNNNTFDGDVIQLQKFVELISKARHTAFELPDNNVLTDGVVFEEDLLAMNFKDYSQDFRDKVFYKSVSKEYLLERFSTDVLFFGGIDPWQTVEGNNYSLYFSSVKNLFYYLIFLLIQL